MTLLTAAQVGRILGLSLTKVYDLARSGELPSFKFGTAVRFDPAQVTEYITSCRSQKTKKLVDSILNLTASSARKESGLESVFLRAGIKVKQTPTTGRNQPGFMPSLSESSAKVTALRMP